jgi:hypothetical protein
MVLDTLLSLTSFIKPDINIRHTSLRKGGETMKKIIALFTAMAFALTLGVAFAQEQTAPAAAPEKKEEKAPAKKKKAAKKAKKKKAAKTEEAAPAAPAAPEAK